MKITFISNYINHHQIPLSNALYELLEGEYYFIQTQPMEEDRVKMGWGAEVEQLPYVRRMDEQEKECRRLLAQSDVVIVGGDYYDESVEQRMEAGKLTLRYCERIYRTGQWKMISPRGLIRKYRENIRFRKMPVYLLCTGGYVADDFRLIGAYPGKMLQWGYFPENYTYDIEALLQEKAKKEFPLMLWAGRMMELKHPEYAISMAKALKDKGYEFRLHMVGDGEMKETAVRMVKEYGLEEQVTFFDFMEPKAVRKKMEEADIYLMTSNRMEGWGAVINEAMNSGCAVIGSHMIGAVPSLIRHGENGLVFKSGSVESLTAEAEKVLADAGYRAKLGRNAYETIDKSWNAGEAAKRLVAFCRTLDMEACSEGPCARAIPVREYKMYGKLTH